MFTLSCLVLISFVLLFAAAATPLTRRAPQRDSASGIKFNRIRLSRSVYESIRRTIGDQPAESGGLLGGSRKEGVVRVFRLDPFAFQSGGSYSPNIDFVNKTLKDELNPTGIHLLGFVHSHPPGFRRPSRGDMVYAQRILEHNPDLNDLLLPIVMTQPDTGRFELLPYRAVRDGSSVRIEEVELEIAEDNGVGDLPAEARSAQSDANASPSSCLPSVSFARPDSEGSQWETFLRVQNAYDLSRLAISRIVAVGTGGAVGFLEDMARAGVGEFILIDPDTVSKTNLATQQVYRRDLKRPKVRALGERILEINPEAIVIPAYKKLDDIDDAEFQRLASRPLRHWQVPGRSLWGIPGLNVSVQVAVKPAVTLICGFTDSFDAQARVNRLALNLGLPSLCAQVYQEGRGAELTFTYPGITSACHRCMLSSRYKAYAEGFQNNVTSDGTPIFATTRLNALKGFVAMALLHHGTNHPRWGALLKRIGNRNLLQIRMDPDLQLKVFERVFGGGDSERILFDDVVWLPQKPENPASGTPACPDCGGTGELRKAIGTFTDTRVMRK